MKRILLLLPLVLAACVSLPSARGDYKTETERAAPYYLTTEASNVQDTCPGHDILRQYACSAKQPDGFSCFDVYMAEGSPVDAQRYTLLKQTVQTSEASAEPLCPEGIAPDCGAFLQALNYNLEFSWYLVNFPTSSFEQCRETYDCKRIDCYLPSSTAESASTLLSCVYKRNQVFFVGSQITCRQLLRQK